MAFIAIFAAINYIVFSYLKIDIPLAAGSSVAIHVANAIVVVSAFLLGPAEGGVAGAIGLSIADLPDPRYVASAPKTFFLKFCIGYLSGKVGPEAGTGAGRRFQTGGSNRSDQRGGRPGLQRGL